MVISSLILCIQIVCEFDFFIKLLIILKFSQHHWIVKVWSNCFLLLFLKLFVARSLLETYVMRDGSDFPHKLFPSFIYSTKSRSLLNSPIIKKIYYLKLLFSFLTFFRLSHMYILCWELISWKKVLLLFVCFPLQKKLDRSSYYVTMTHYVVILILFLFTFVANVQDLEWDNFLVLTMNRKGVTRIYLPRA